MPEEEKKRPSLSAIKARAKKLEGKAEEYLRSQEKTKRLLDAALKKAREQSDNQGPLADVWAYLHALIRLLRAYSRHEYTDVSRSTMVLVTVAIIYLVSPIDLIPDFIVGAGYLDDAMLIAWVIRQIKIELDKFIRWEAERGGDGGGQAGAVA